MNAARAFALALVATSFSLPVGGVAQQAPPPPLPMGDVAFPDFEERTLASGARLVVVPQHEVPLVTVNLVLPGGSVADPDGAEGVASFVAQLLTRGTEIRSKQELAEAVDFLGASLTAGASDDWSTVSLAVVSPALEIGLALMADAVLNPSFPDDELELLRTQTLSALQFQLGQAGALAARAFTRHVYGGHAYGRLVTPASVQAVDRTSLVAFHETWYRPGGALFVVAGDVEADRVARLLDEAFDGWPAGTVPELDHGAAPGRIQPDVVIVHRPGAVQTEVRAGHLIPPGSMADWTVLSVANQVLGGGSSGRLFQVLREERGYTYGASSSVARRRDQGTFLAAMAVRTEVTGEAVAELLELIEGIRREAVPEDELQDTKDFLVGSFPLQIETPQQVAAQVTSTRLLGLPIASLETFRERVSALDPPSVRAAAERYLRPQDILIVAAGDANRLRDQLSTLGHVRVEDAEGRPLTLADLSPRAPSETVDPSGLVPDTLEYEVRVQGNVVGRAVRMITRPEPGRIRFASEVEAGPQTVNQEVMLTDAFELISSRNEIAAMGQTFTLEAWVEDGRLVGEIDLPGQSQEIEMAAPDGVVVSDMVELALRVMTLEVGRELSLPMAVLQTETVENVVLRVAERGEVTVPAGTFDAYRVEMTGPEAQTFWVEAAAPHRVLRIQAGGQPLSLELTARGGGGGGS
jgi:zinc protease